jgi:DNA-binding MarR family transcriptional regulator
MRRRLLDVIDAELSRLGRADINAAQAFLLYQIGHNELTVAELRTRGHYGGSDVSYNLKRLVETGFLDRQRSERDRRSIVIKLTEKGAEVRDLIETVYERQIASVERVAGISPADLKALNGLLRRLERFWADQILYQL